MKIEINGTDCTKISDFTVRIDGNDQEINEQTCKIVNTVLEYAFDPKKNLLLKAHDDKDEVAEQAFSLPNSLRNREKRIKKTDIYPWEPPRKQQNEQGEKWIGPIAGYFGFFIPQEDSSDLNSLIIELVDIPSDPLGYDVTVAINSRVDYPEEPGETKRPFFLLRMLEAASPDFYIDGQSEVPTSVKEIWEELLVQQFRNKLMELRGLGFYRSYVMMQENNDRPKGSIDISRHIRLNNGQSNGRIAYSHREKTYDNPLNRFILKAFDLLRKQYPHQMLRVLNRDPDFKRAVSELGFLCVSAINSSEKAVLSENQRPINSPYYHPYEEMRKICIKIFRRCGASYLLEEDKKTADGFIMYIPDLFEIYVEERVRSVFDTNRFSLDYQVSISGPYDISNKNLRYMRPDYLLYERKNEVNAPRLVLDAKYKTYYKKLFAEKIKNPSKYHICQDGQEERVIQDCRKLLRDISAILIEGFNSSLDFIDMKLDTGVLIFPVTIEGKETVFLVKEEIVEECIDGSKWKEAIEKLCLGENEDIRQVYRSAYINKRKEKLEAYLNPIGKKILFLAIPVYTENKTTVKYGDWKQIQTNLEESWANIIRDSEELRNIIGNYEQTEYRD